MHIYNPFLTPELGKIIIVVHAPGSGGNHLANIISLSKGNWFGRDLNFLEKYENRGVKTPLNSFAVNTFDLMNYQLQLDQVVETVRTKGQNAIFTMHAYELLAHCHTDLIARLHPAIWLVSLLPNDDVNSRHPCLQRILFSNNMDVFRSFEIVQELIALYKPDALNKIQPGHWASFEAANLWIEDAEVICNALSSTLPIVFDQTAIETCKRMHRIWLPRIMRQIENFRTRKSAGGST
jgi:hypothetical protein